eukprot:804681-Pelagomonas_calceolata.AAC.2
MSGHCWLAIVTEAAEDADPLLDCDLLASGGDPAASRQRSCTHGSQFGPVTGIAWLQIYAEGQEDEAYIPTHRHIHSHTHAHMRMHARESFLSKIAHATKAVAVFVVGADANDRQFDAQHLRKCIVWYWCMQDCLGTFKSTPVTYHACTCACAAQRPSPLSCSATALHTGPA